MSNPPPSRDDSIRTFWEGVRERLQRTYHRTSDEAIQGIGRYRWETEQQKIGDVIYNQGVERTAEMVNGVIEYGLPR